jgi:hypothetical protein
MIIDKNLAKCFYKIKNTALRDNLTSEYFSNIKNHSIGDYINDYKDILINTIKKCDDPNYIRQIVDYGTEILTPDNSSFRDISFLTGINDDNTVHKIFSFMNNLPFSQSSNLPVIKQIFYNIKDPKIKSQLAERIISYFVRQNFIDNLKECGYMTKYLTNDQLKIDYLTKIIKKIKEEQDSSKFTLTEDMYQNMIDTLKSIEDPSKKKLLIKQFHSLRDKLTEKYVAKSSKELLLDEFEEVIEKTNLKALEINNVLEQILSKYIQEGITKEKIERFLLSSTHPERLSKLTSDYNKFLNNAYELILNNPDI